ncbi:MAG: hypothetical protein ACFFDC_11970 [Promethearchaeota archaeon]
MSWKEKWVGVLNIIGKYLEQSGMKMMVINIDARPDIKEQYEMYMATVEDMKGRREVVVTTGLPGEERIFWPYEDVQFYIREGEEKVHSTGNPDILEELFQTSEL